MPWLLGLAIVAIAAVVLDPALEARVDGVLSNFNKAIIGSTYTAAGNAALKYGLIFSVTGTIVYILQSKATQKAGIEGPSAPPGGLPAPPSFGGSSGFSLGPYSTSGTVTGGQMMSGGRGTPAPQRSVTVVAKRTTFGKRG